MNRKRLNLKESLNGKPNYKTTMKFMREVILPSGGLGGSGGDFPHRRRGEKLQAYKARLRAYEEGWQVYRSYAADRNGWWDRAKGDAK